MFGVETEQVGGLIGKTVQVVRVKRHSEYAAYASARVEQIGLVIVNKDMHIERVVPSALHIRSVLPFTQNGVGAQRVISHIERAVVAGHVVLAAVLDYIGGYRNALYGREIPVKHVVTVPRSTARAEHVVSAVIITEYRYIARCVSALANHHRQRVAVAAAIGLCV